MQNSAQGALAEIHLKTTTGTLSIIGTYWPKRPNEQDRDDSRGLWNRIQQYLQQQKIHDDPVVYLQRVTLEWISRSRQAGCQGTIVGGDLNSTWLNSDPGGDRVIRNWCENNYLINGPRQIHDMYGPPIEPNSGVHHHFVTRGNSNWSKYSWIDHILHTGRQENIDIVGACNGFGADLADLSDHKPIWCIYRTALPAAPRAIKMPATAPIPELPRQDPLLIAWFKEQMTDILYQIPNRVDELKESEEALELATKCTVHMTQRALEEFGQQRKVHKHKDGHSPEFMLRKWHLMSVIEIQRHLLGQHGKTRWTSSHMVEKGINYIYDALWARANGLKLKSRIITTIIGTKNSTTSYWISLATGHIKDKCEAEIKHLSKLLHGRKRVDMRKAGAGYMSWVELQREIGKTGKVIKAVLGVHAGRKHSDRVTPDSLTLPAEVVLGDPEQIHNAMTEHAQRHFSVPPECNTPFHLAKDWEPYVQDIDLFLESFKDSNIPVHLLRIIHQSLQPKPNASLVHEELLRELECPPSLEEFKQGIKAAKTNSAPGPSGLSYNMAKAWPDSMVEYIYENMRSFWIPTKPPASWNWKWLNYIPKVVSDNVRLPDLRPLMLIEILRKLWSSHISTKIMGAIRRHHMLDDAHHGYISGRGTTTAILLNINQAEDAEEKQHASNDSSYDQSSAFDKTPRPGLTWSKRRLGVPKVIAEYITDMDSDDTTVIKSDYGSYLWKLLPYLGFKTNGSYPAGLPSTDSNSFKGESLSAARGTGQGAPNSPPDYMIFDDINATGMRILDEQAKPTYVGAGDNEVYKHEDTSFADDKKSASYSAEHIQLKAELYSAFNIVFGLTFSESKIRRVLQNFLPDPDKHPLPTMFIYTHGWKPVPIKVLTTGSTKYLGGIYDVDNSGKGALESMINTAKLHCTTIQHTRFSPEAKLVTATSSSFDIYGKSAHYRIWMPVNWIQL